MNQKGFTLVELLATIVILGVVMGIASYGVISIISNSKKKTESVFVERVSNFIDEYLTLSLRKNKFSFDGTSYCISNCSSDNKVVVLQASNSFKLGDLVNEKIVDEDKLVNPVNKKKCLDLNNNINPSVVLYRDSNYLYYYYVDLSGANTNCGISDDNAILTNMDKNSVSKLKTAGISFPSKLLKKVGLE